MINYYRNSEFSYKKLGIEKLVSISDQEILPFVQATIETYQLSNPIRILDIGCGLGHLASDLAIKFKANVLGIDVSEKAIQLARKRFSTTPNLSFLLADITNFDFPHKFDLIIDNHTFHCLITPKHRKMALESIRSLLSPNGKFISETMVYHRDLAVTSPLMLDKNNILWKQVQSSDKYYDEVMIDERRFIPIRKVSSVIEIEDELKKSQFDIHSLRFHPELKFEIEGQNQTTPCLLRFIAGKKAIH